MNVTDDAVSSTKEGAGIVIRTLKPGDNKARPKVGDSCIVHYDCHLENGTKVDSTRDRKQPLQFEIGVKHVIPGLEVAVQRLSKSQLVEVTIPHLYAYGQRGHLPEIPPRSTLLFTLELVEILPEPKQRRGWLWRW